MTSRVIAFVTDEGFLIPTLQAALQVARQTAVVARADIVIVLTTADELVIDVLRGILKSTPIRLILMDLRRYNLPNHVSFNKTHVPLASLARLWLHEVLPSHYEHIIYLDGDIQIVGELLPLVTYDVLAGRIGAAPEAAWIYQGELGRYWPFLRSYLARLGINDPTDYFNAGVLLLRRDTLSEYAPKAMQFFVDHSDRCIYHDQSALNAVLLGRRETISPRWNFISGYFTNSDAAIEELRVIHFTGGRKPWNYMGPPWYGRFSGEYTALLHRFPALEGLRGRVMMPQPCVPVCATPSRLLWHGRAPWRPYLRDRRIKRFMRETPFALP